MLNGQKRSRRLGCCTMTSTAEKSDGVRHGLAASPLCCAVVGSAANVMRLNATLRSGSQLIAEDQGWGPGCVKLVAVLFSAEREHNLSDAHD